MYTNSPWPSVSAGLALASLGSARRVGSAAAAPALGDESGEISSMKIVIDDLSGSEIAAFLAEHIKDMKSVSPPESKHALDIDGLRAAEITFWSIYDGGKLVGCGALKEIDKTHGEIKSMRTAASMRGRGVGSMLLSHILKAAKSRGYSKVRSYGSVSWRDRKAAVDS